jgi:hypothetical protein
MKLDSTLVCVLLATIAPVLALFLAIIWDRRQRKQIEKPPQSEKLLRPAGYSLSIKLDEIIDEVVKHILFASMFSAFSAVGATTLANLLGMHASASYVMVFSVVTALFLAGCIRATLRAFHLFNKGLNIRLGLRGEQAVAEALNEAADSGFRAFHDLQTDKVGNLDHVAVGTRGVFMVETKARRKRGPGNGLAPHEVGYDGETLQFPQGRDADSIEQARYNAVWLSNYLRNETGDPVEVFPLVVLPGWFVKKSERGNFRVEVMAAKFLPGFLARQTEKIEPSQVRRIITALDKKCRNVEF